MSNFRLLLCAHRLLFQHLLRRARWLVAPFAVCRPWVEVKVAVTLYQLIGLTVPVTSHSVGDPAGHRPGHALFHCILICIRMDQQPLRLPCLFLTKFSGDGNRWIGKCESVKFSESERCRAPLNWKRRVWYQANSTVLHTIRQPFECSLESLLSENLFDQKAGHKLCKRYLHQVTDNQFSLKFKIMQMWVTYQLVKFVE